MSTLELKGRITEGIAVVSDEAFLMHLLEMITRWRQSAQYSGHALELQEIFAKETFSDVESDWWDELTPQQQLGLELALKEIEYPANLISHEDFLKSIERWRKPKA